MGNEYKSFYLKDLLPMIDMVALRAMRCPHITDSPNASGIWKESNADIALFNGGIMHMAASMRAMLETEDESDGTGA